MGTTSKKSASSSRRKSATRKSAKRGGEITVSKPSGSAKFFAASALRPTMVAVPSRRQAEHVASDKDEIVAQHPPVHPGRILRREFLDELGLTPYAVAKACHMPRSKLERIVRGELGISGDTAVRLGRYFGTSDRFWMNLQATYEVMKAREAIGDAINEVEPLQAA
jgi:addiction module HigA family antidote